MFLPNSSHHVVQVFSSWNAPYCSSPGPLSNSIKWALRLRRAPKKCHREWKIRDFSSPTDGLSRRPKWQLKAVRERGTLLADPGDSNSITRQEGHTEARGSAVLESSKRDDRPETATDAQSVFAASHSTHTRLREASQYMQRKHDAIRARNGLWRIQDGSDWSINWEIPLEMLKLDHQRGQYVHDAEASDDPRRPKILRKERWRWRLSQEIFPIISPWDLENPKVLSTQAFRDYIQRLITLKVPTPLQRNLYRPKEPRKFTAADAHQVQIQQKLEWVFRNEEFRPFLSTEAFELAFHFLTRRSMLNTTRVLLNIMIESRTKLKTSTFNILLQSAAHQNDLRFFTYVLRLKRALNIPSDAHTWGAFLRTIHAKRVKLRVVQEMEALGILGDPVAMQESVAATIESDVKSLAKLGEPLTQLVSRYDARFDRSWLTLSTGNHLCSLLGAVGYLERIPYLLTLMTERGCPPTAQTLTILLHLISPTSDIKRALRLVRLFQAQYHILCRPQHLHILFKLAWSTHSFNLCRIIWILACRNAAATSRMKHLVYQSLLRNTPAKPETSGERWAKEAGKIIPFSRPKNPILKSLLGYHSPKSGERLFWAARDTPERVQQIALAKTMIRRDLLACRSAPFRGDFLPLFEVAFVRDQEWVRDDVLMSRPLMWKQQSVLRLAEPYLWKQARFRTILRSHKAGFQQLGIPLPRAKTRHSIARHRVATESKGTPVLEEQSARHTAPPH